jgi:translation initiation factor IF-3
MPTSRALAQAQSLGLDLVEIVPNAKPPVCIITDFSKLKYDLGKAEKDKKKKAKQSAVQNEVKELRLSPVIDDGDIDVKIRNAREFLNDKKKVRFVLFFKNRQMQFKDRGYTIVFRVIKSLSDVAEVERQPVLEGKRIICVLKPLLKNN